MRSHRAVVPAALAFLFACHSPGRSGPGLLQPDDRLAELRGAFGALAAQAATGDFVTAISGAFAGDGVYLSNTPELLRGPAGARTWMVRDTLATRSRAYVVPVRLDVSADGRDGYSYGYLDVVHPAGDTVYGQYKSYWRRDAGGRWGIIVFTRGRRAPGPAPANFPAELAAANASRNSVAGGDTAATLEQIKRTEAEFADSAGVDTPRAFVTFAAPDVGKIEGGANYAFGKAGVAGLFAAPPPPGALGPMWTPQFGSAAASGDLGFTLGPAWPRKAGPVQDPPPPNAGRYFTIWKRQPDGRWRYLVD